MSVMSEALPPDDDSRPPAEVVSIEAARSQEYDFSEAPIELSIDFLLSELRDPAHNGKKGLELAAFLESELTSDESRDPREPQENLARAIRLSHAFDDDVFDTKVTHDRIFNELVTVLKQTADQRSLKAQRHAALRLAEVRALLEHHTTEHDDQWQDTIERLFT